jgi:hypothetical protein
VILLGSVASLIGGVAHTPVTVKAGATIDVTVKAKAQATLGVVANSKSITKKTTSAKIEKGKRAMKTINKGSRHVWCKASALVGGDAPNRNPSSRTHQAESLTKTERGR